MTHTAVGYYTSPIGALELRVTSQGLQSVLFTDAKAQASVSPLLQPYTQALDAYFSGNTQAFLHIQFSVDGTVFQQRVWQELQRIPYGKTVTYGSIATKIGSPKAVRAVGTAVGKNPLSIFVPCHRVLPATGKVGAYAWGTDRKQWLLQHEMKTTHNMSVLSASASSTKIPSVANFS